MNCHLRERLIRVVRPASQLEIRHVSRPAGREWDHMVVFEKRGLTTAAIRTRENTAAAVASPDLALDGSGDVASLSRRRRAVARHRGSGPLRSLHLVQQQPEGAIQNLLRIAVGDRVAQQCPQALEAVVCILADCEFEQVALWRERRERCAPFRTRRWWLWI